MNHRYLFSVGIELTDFVVSDVYVDCFHEVQSPRITDPKALQVALQFDPNLGDEDSKVYQMIKLRNQFNSDRLRGPFLVSTDDPIDRETLESIIQSKFQSNQLSQFLEGAKI